MFDPDTVARLVRVLARADYGCPTCTEKLAVDMESEFPGVPWLNLVREQLAGGPDEWGT